MLLHYGDGIWFLHIDLIETRAQALEVSSFILIPWVLGTQFLSRME